MFNDPRVLLLYPPEQNWPETLCKPNGSLAYPMLGGAFRVIPKSRYIPSEHTSVNMKIPFKIGGFYGGIV